MGDAVDGGRSVAKSIKSLASSLSKGQRAAPTKRRVGVPTSKNGNYDSEILKKENEVMIRQLRGRAQFSSNPLYRAHHLAVPLFYQDGDTRAEESENKRIERENKLNSLRQEDQWVVAERRHKILHDELNSIDKEIQETENKVRAYATNEVQDDIMSTGYNTTDLAIVAAHQYPPTNTSIGSSFRWRNNVANSVSRTDYNWNIDQMHRLYQVTSTQYGDCSRLCDYLGPKASAIPRGVKSKKSTR